MLKTKISFQDVKIGDMVLTTNNKIGEIIAIKSYAYLNDKIAKKTLPSVEAKELPFKFDNNRHNGVWYATVTVAIEDKSKSIPTYYTENLDFIEIKKLLKEEPKKSLFDKIKNIFKRK